MKLLKVDQLKCVRSEKSLFEEICFSLSANECLHIQGANGSGKTSLLRILAGLLSYEQGTIEWFPKPSFSYLAHKNGLKDELSAIENLRFYQNLNGQYKEQHLDQTLHALGLLKQADSLSQKLSFGQQRRLAFARLLLSEHKVWILDEPFTGVDIDGRALLEQLCLNHLNSGGGIILSHHADLSHSKLSEHLSILDLCK